MNLFGNGDGEDSEALLAHLEFSKHVDGFYRAVLSLKNEAGFMFLLSL